MATLQFSCITAAQGPLGQAIIVMSIADMTALGVPTKQTIGIGIPDESEQIKAIPQSYTKTLSLTLALGDEESSDVPKCDGRKQLLVAAWPSPSLARGSVQLGKEIWELLGRPACQDAIHLTLNPPGSQTCSKLYARLVLNAATQRAACLPSADATNPPARSSRASVSEPPTTPTPKTPPPSKSSRKSLKSTPSRASIGTTPYTPTTPLTPALQSTPVPPPGLSGTSLEWLMDTIISGQTDLPQRMLLSQLAARHWHRRQLVRRNVVLLPLLGRRVLFEIMGADSSDGQALDVCTVLFDATEVVLMAPESSMPSQEERFTSDSASALQEEAASHDALLDEARAAAEAAVATGDAAQAAGDAAVRAVRAGLNSKGVTYEQLGGVELLRQAMMQLVTYPLCAPSLFSRFGVKLPKGVLLYGPPGTGKTVLARAAAAEAGVPLLIVNGPELLSEYLGESEGAMRGLFAAAQALAPAIIFMDEIDALAPARSNMSARGTGSQSSEAGTRLLTTLLTEMDGLQDTTPNRHVIVLAATNRLDSVDMALRRPGRFDREIQVGVPTPAARLSILETVLKGMQHRLTDSQVSELAMSLHGFVAADISALCNEAAMSVLRRWVYCSNTNQATDSVDVSDVDQLSHLSEVPSLVIEMSDMQVASTRVRPSAMREVMLEVPKVSWKDVGGLDHVKAQLKEAVEWPQQRNGELERMNAKPPRGVLLYGPPGCSKTLLAKAVANEAKLNFMAVKGSELYSKYVGESEKAVALLFTRARLAAPAIIFFDEIDGLTGARGASSAAAGVRERVLSQLLSEMDGLQHRAGVVVLAATNRPDKLDTALLRPGRFDRLVYVSAPDTNGREAILNVLLKSTPLGDDITANELAERTAGFTGADLRSLVRESAMHALQESLESESVCKSHFDAALKHCSASPQVADELLAVYEGMARGGGIRT